ncbi:MAG: hypothetical protein NVS3B10_10920 [Polyangiales bacterium]
MPTPRPLLSVSLKDLESGAKPLRAPLPAAWLTTKLAEVRKEGDPELTATVDGVVDATLSPSGGDNFLLQGRVEAAIDTICGRCLGPAKVAVDAELTMLLVPATVAATRAPKGKRSKDSEGEFEFDPEESDVSTYTGDSIVLDDLVREAILLEQPISPLCSDDCPGMRTDPAVAAQLPETRVDPRFAKLAGLRDKVRK